MGYLHVNIRLLIQLFQPAFEKLLQGEFLLAIFALTLIYFRKIPSANQLKILIISNIHFFGQRPRAATRLFMLIPMTLLTFWVAIIHFFAIPALQILTHLVTKSAVH